MSTGTIVVMGMAAVVLGGVIYFFRRNEVSASNDSQADFDPKKAFDSLDLNDMKIEKVDFLNFEDIIKWFKAFGLKKDVDIPFVLTNVSQIVENLPLPETDHGEVEGFTAIVLGVLDQNSNLIKDRNLIYYKETDEKVKDMLTHAKNGIVVLA